MVTYSVKQVAEILGTNEETVRRWIRSGKLKAEKTSNKEGNAIKETALAAFAKASPRYSSKIRGGATTGIMLATFGLAGATNAILEVKKAEEKALSKARVGADTIYAFLAKRIGEERSELEKMLSEREDLDKKIQIETEIIDGLIEQLNSLDGATVNKVKRVGGKKNES